MEISKGKIGPITDVIYSPHLDFIVYNLLSKVACDRIWNFTNNVFNANIRRAHISEFKRMFFNDVKAVRGKKIEMPPDDFNIKDYLPFSQEELLSKNLNALPLALVNDIFTKLNNGEKLEGSETQLLMNFIKQSMLTDVLSGPSLDDFVTPELEDKIFEWADSD